MSKPSSYYSLYKKEALKHKLNFSPHLLWTWDTCRSRPVSSPIFWTASWKSIHWGCHGINWEEIASIRPLHANWTHFFSIHSRRRRRFSSGKLIKKMCLLSICPFRKCLSRIIIVNISRFIVYCKDDLCSAFLNVHISWKKWRKPIK